MKIYLKYSFIFDPRETWAYRDEFENDLAQYFRSKGLETEVVRSTDETKEEVMIYLKRDGSMGNTGSK